MNRFEHKYTIDTLIDISANKKELSDICPMVLHKMMNDSSMVHIFPSIMTRYSNNIDVPPTSIEILPYPLLVWVRNSCYIDSVLVSLLLIPNSFINSFILEKYVFTTSNRFSPEKQQSMIKIQDELRTITTHMRSNRPYNCSLFRTYIKQFGTEPYPCFWKGNMEDACEFLLFIEMVFLPDVLLSNNVYSSIVYTITDMSIRTLHSYGDTITYTPYLIFYASRNTGYVFDTSDIEPNQYIETKNNILYLHSIVIFCNNHYMAFIKNSEWFLYDDIRGLTHIGSYETMMSRYAISKIWVLSFYS